MLLKNVGLRIVNFGLALSLVFAFGTFGAFGATVRADAAKGGLQQQIDNMIRLRHPQDTRDWWLGLGPQAPGVIMQMVESPEYRELTLQKMRLLQGLAWFAPQNPGALDYLKEQATATQEEVVRRAVIEAVGISEGAKEAEWVGKFLQSPDPQTRIAAAESLKRMNDPTASRLVEAQLAVEKAPWVLDRLKNVSRDDSAPVKLKPVSSSEERLNRELVGAWRGFWIAPQRNQEKIQTLAQREAILELKPVGTENLEGELRLPAQAGAPAIFYKLRAKGKGLAFSGNAKANDSSESVIEGQLARRAGVLILEIRFDAATLIASPIRR